ncbi:uncharacterized protein [Bactrocera oleae]|uniref:uncharacterized protein n=1 Tax=Bactrocera oleae TaxID=104688 RepID=UPI00387EABA0
MSSSSERLEEETKILTNSKVLPDKIAEVNEEVIILKTTKTKTSKHNENIDLPFESDSSENGKENLSKAGSKLLDGGVAKSYENKDILFESESSEIFKEKVAKAHNNLLNGSADYIGESTTIDPSYIENKLWKDTTTEVVEADITNTTSNFDTALTAPVNYDENLRPLNDDTDSTTQDDIKSTEFTNESPLDEKLNFNEAADIQLRGIVDILTESVKTLRANEINGDIHSTTEDSMKNEIELSITEFPIDRSEVDIARIKNGLTVIGIFEAGGIEYGGTSDAPDQEYLTTPSTESAPQHVTTDLVKVSTTDFTNLHTSKTDTTSQGHMEPTTESVSLIKTSEGITTPSSTILVTFENTNSVKDVAVETKKEFETPSSNENKSQDFEMFEIRNSVEDLAVEAKTKLENLSKLKTLSKSVDSVTKKNKPKLKLPQTTTYRSRELNSLNPTAPTKLPSLSSSRPKQVHTPSAWYTNIIPLYPIYLLNPFNYFYNSTNQTLSGPGAPPIAWTPPIFNITNLLSQVLLSDAPTTARHSFFQQTQSNLTNFQFFPLSRLFNKTKFTTNTQTATTINGSDVLTNGNANNALFVSRQWYTPLVTDNLVRSNEVPFLTPVVRYSNNDRSYYRNQGQQMHTPVITYVQRVEPYRIERPSYYRESPKLIKRPTTYYREQPYYPQRPYDIERPYQVDRPSYHHYPVKSDDKVQSGPISHESSPMDLSYTEPIRDVDKAKVAYYYANKKLNATSPKSAEEKPKEATTSFVEVEMPNPIYKFMKSIYNIFMSNN